MVSFFKCLLKKPALKITWVAFFYFLTVRFKMSLRTPCIGGCKVTLFRCVFSSVLKLSPREEAKSHWLHLFNFFPLCIFKCYLKALFQEDVKTHCLHFNVFSPFCFIKCVLKSPAKEDASSHWLHLFFSSTVC